MLTTALLAVSVQAKECMDCHDNQSYLESKDASSLYVSKKKFGKDTHAMFECITCHEGDKSANSVEGIHEEVIANPASTDTVGTTCAQCHTDISARFEKSLHGTARGQKNGAVHLMGEEVGTEVWDDYCARCHADCSDCHLQKKDKEGNMITDVEGHNFEKAKDENCIDCHSQTGFSYVGWGEDYPESAHSKAGMECVDCHGEEQVHGTGEEHQSMTEVVDNKCEDCHSNDKAEYSDSLIVQFNEKSYAHETHEEKLDCSACHTSWYMNCQEGCHLEEPPKYSAGELTSDDFYLNKYKGKVYTMTKTPLPAYPDISNKDVPEEAWVTKVRHSWSSEAKSCEFCHTNKEIYPQEGDVLKGELFKEETVERIYIEKEKYKNSIHGQLGMECADCHQTDRTEKCSDCHDLKDVRSIVEISDKAKNAKGDLKEKLNKIRKEFHYNSNKAQNMLQDLTAYGMGYSKLSKDDLIGKYKSLRKDCVDLRTKHNKLVNHYDDLGVKYNKIKTKLIEEGCSIEEKQDLLKRVSKMDQTLFQKEDYTTLSKDDLVKEYKNLKTKYIEIKAEYANLVDYYGDLKLKYDEFKDKEENGCDSGKQNTTKKVPTGC
jgi:hypothetical protein